MNGFLLKIIACDKVFFDGECESFVFPGYDGEMAILANHEPMTTTIEVGEIRFRKPGETKWQRAIVSDGLIKVEHNLVNVLVQFLLDIGAVAVPGGGVCRSQCLFLHGGEDIQRVAHGAICHLQHAGTGLGVGIRLLQAANADSHGFADRIK